MTKTKGVWIFLSHSTLDWDGVREIRNLLEHRGHRPLVFFLKCLTDHAELDELIKREIEARSWFLLCDSENAQQSSWVQAEIAHIKSLEGKHYEEINLDMSIESQINRIDHLCKRLTVFVSYAYADKLYANHFEQALSSKEYLVWQNTCLAVGKNWMKEIEGAIDRAVDQGFFLILLSLNSIQSQSVIYEIEYAFNKASKAKNSANILPIMIDDPVVIMSALPSPIRPLLGGIQWFDFSGKDFNLDIETLVSYMKACVMD